MAQILIIEDDPCLREVMRDNLESDGHAVLAAEDGEVAIRLLNGGKRPDLIFVDMMMPGMDGFSFLEYRKQHPEFSGSKIILVSASDHEMKRGDLGIDGFLKKPFDFEDLLQIASRTVMH